jgi:hypothetical protein
MLKTNNDNEFACMEASILGDILSSSSQKLEKSRKMTMNNPLHVYLAGSKRFRLMVLGTTLILIAFVWNIIVSPSPSKLQMTTQQQKDIVLQHVPTHSQFAVELPKKGEVLLYYYRGNPEEQGWYHIQILEPPQLHDGTMQVLISYMEEDNEQEWVEFDANNTLGLWRKRSEHVQWRETMRNRTAITTTVNGPCHHLPHHQHQPQQPFYAHEKVFGHLHVAKTAGTEINGELAAHFSNICGHKG